MRYCSIGPDCHSSALLKLINLKTESYPFDWSVSSLTKIIDCIEDKFAKFLDKSLYYKKEEHNAGHTHYGDKLFFHRNPLNSKEDYEYYQRCTKRFLDLLQSDEPKTFFYTTKTPINERMILFDSKLGDHCKNYRIICIVYNQNRPVHQYSLSIQGNIYFLTVDILSERTGSHLKNPEDSLYVSRLILTKI